MLGTSSQDFIGHSSRKIMTGSNGSPFKNPDTSGAIFTLEIEYEYILTQCEDGARGVSVFKWTPVTSSHYFTGRVTNEILT